MTTMSKNRVVKRAGSESDGDMKFLPCFLFFFFFGNKRSILAWTGHVVSLKVDVTYLSSKWYPCDA